MLKSLPTRSLATDEGKELEAAGGAVPSLKLPLQIEKQLQDQWCWAAVSASVSKFFLPSSNWTQCLIACDELSKQTCCVDSEDCDQWWYLDKALMRTNNLDQFITGQVNINNVAQLLKLSKPVCIRVQWPNRSGHFLAIVGMQTGSDGMDYLLLSDPIFGDSCYPVASMSGSYQNAKGYWTHTYYTRP